DSRNNGANICKVSKKDNGQKTEEETGWDDSNIGLMLSITVQIA
ncbi:10981_t:CDS:1, partial [Funneliformis mosseae]